MRFLLTIPVAAALLSGCVVSKKQYLEQVDKTNRLEDELQSAEKSKRETITKLEKEKAAREAAVRRATENEARLKEQITAISAQFAEKAEALQKKLNAAKEMADALDERLKKTQSDLADVQKALEAETAKNAQMAAAVKEKDLKIDDLQANLTSERNALAKTRNELAAANSEAESASARLEEMESKSGGGESYKETLKALEEVTAEFSRAKPLLSQRSATIAVFLKQQGRLQEAETEFRKALELDERNAKARRGLALLLEEAGNAKDALAEWKKLLSQPEHAGDARAHIDKLGGAAAGSAEEAEPKEESE